MFGALDKIIEPQLVHGLHFGHPVFMVPKELKYGTGVIKPSIQAEVTYPSAYLYLHFTLTHCHVLPFCPHVITINKQLQTYFFNIIVFQFIPLA